MDSAFKYTQKISKVRKSAYLTLITLIITHFLLPLKVYGKLKTSAVFNSKFELKVQKHDSHFAFSRTILIHIDSALKYTQ